MSDPGTARAARKAPDREIKDAVQADPQLDLLDDVLSPEEQADEHKRQIEALQKEAETARTRAAENERALQSERAQREEAQKGAVSAQEQAVSNQIDALQQLVSQAKMSIRQAREVGDLDAEEKALDQLTDAKANLVNLNNQKAYIETLKKQGPQPQVRQADQQDQYRGPHGYSRASEDWISQHPEFDNDPEFQTTVVQAAQAALTKHAPDSYGFFKFLDDVVAKRYGGNQQQNANTKQNQPARRGPLASSVAAGPSRSNVQRDNTNGPNPAAIAQKLGVTVKDLEDFAKVARMPVDKYIAEQAKILEEEAQGLDTGLYRGDSR